MPTQVFCSNCASFNGADATHCRSCGRKLETAPEANPEAVNVLLQRVMSGEVFTAVFDEEAKRPTPAPQASQAPPVRVASAPIPENPPVEDHSDVIAAAVDRIRAKAHEEGHRFKPYVRSKGRKATTPGAEDLGKHLDLGVALLRERRFEEAIGPLLKAIARDDEDRRPWILLGEAYLRIERPYKAAVAYLRSLELSPKDEQAWLGLGRVLRSLDELPTAAAVLERATRIHPDHADSWAERGFIYAGMRKLPDAARSLNKALDLRPDHRLALAKRNEIDAMVRDQRVPGTGSIKTEVPPKKTVTKGGETNRDSEILEKMEKSLGDDEEQVVSPTVTASPHGKTLALMSPDPSKRPARVRTFVEGLDETLDGGIPWGHVVLLEGAPGTMKSSLGFSILLHNAARQGLHCLYLSLEERASSLLKQMSSIGLKLEVPKGSLVVLDPRTAADLLGEKADWVDALEGGIRSIKGQRGLDLILIDSLEALEVLAKFKDRRREMYRLFEWLRDLDVTSIVVTERPDWLIAGHVLQGRWDEDFLADAVLHLRIHMVSDVEAQRRLRVVKMRGTKHETGYVAMVLDEGGFRVTRAMSQ